MSSIKVFTKKNCPQCPSAKSLGEDLAQNGCHVDFYDVDSTDGMAEASFFTVKSTPSLILVDKKRMRNQRLARQRAPKNPKSLRTLQNIKSF